MALTRTTIAAWVMIILSLGVVFVTFPGRYNVVIAPEFLHDWGFAFGLVYAAVQYAFAVVLKSRRAVLFISGGLLVGMGLGAIGRAIDLHGFYAAHEITYASYVFAAGACASALAFGFALLRGWLEPQE